MNNISIEVMYHNPDLIPINFQENGDWIDLRAAEEYHLYPNKFYLINNILSCMELKIYLIESIIPLVAFLGSSAL